MECLRRSVLGDQTLDGRDLNLKNATKLMSLYERQVAALDKHRGRGQQKVTVKYVHVSEGGQAIVGNVAHTAAAADRARGNAAGARCSAGAAARHRASPAEGEGQAMTSRHVRNTGPMTSSPRCGARTRRGTPCQAPAVAGKRRCRMHGGAKGSGAPVGNKNALKLGLHTGAGARLPGDCPADPRRAGGARDRCGAPAARRCGALNSLDAC